jgi:hypothetical protein
MDISQASLIIAADDISCYKSDSLSNALQIMDSATRRNKISPGACAQVELPPPQRFRRQACPETRKGFSGDIKLKIQNLNYLKSYREAIGKLLTDTELTTNRRAKTNGQ